MGTMSIAGATKIPCLPHAEMKKVGVEAMSGEIG